MKYLIIALLLFNFSAYAQEPEVLFDNANAFYLEKNYTAATEAYEQIIGAGYFAPEVYFNLGLSYYKLNKIGPAIYNFEKAKKLEPGNEHIQYALRLARLKTANTEAGYEEGILQRWWDKFVTTFTSTGWGILAIVLIWFAFSMAALFIFTNNPLTKRIAFFVGIFLVIVSGLSAYLSFEYQKRLNLSSEAIVYSDSVKVKAEPELSSGDLFVLYEGAKMTVLEKDGDWIKIGYNENKTGWIQYSNIRFI